MHPSVHLPPSFTQASRARAVLGDHPLVRVLELQDVVRRDLLLLAALAAPIAVTAVLGVAVGLWLLGAVTIAAAALAGGAAVLRTSQRQQALRLILKGHERLPVAAVAAERNRLLDAGHRRTLAHTLELIRTAAQEHPSWLRSSTLPYSVRTVSAAAPRLREIEDLLRSDCPGVRGVALTHQLLVDGGSPLHGGNARSLCEELRRIALLLQGD